MQGESAPKARTKVVVDGKQVNIPAPRVSAMERRRRLGRPGVGSPGERVEAVPLGKSGGATLRLRTSSIRTRLLISRFQENLLSFSLRRPYRKPTQVGRMRILRRLRELG